MHGGENVWIHLIENHDGIIFSDGQFTSGQKHWITSVKEWLIACDERQYAPKFDFVDDRPAAASTEDGKGLPYSPAVSDNPMWGNKIVNDILKKTIYTGDLVQGRRRVKSYKVHQIEAVPEEEWVRVPDTHEAIITHETFDRVQALLLRNTRTAPKTRELHLFSGFLRCADCGKAVTRSQSGKYVYYACSTYKNRSRTARSMHSIKHNRLEAAVLFAIQYQVSIAVSYSEMIAHINSAPLKKVNPTALTTRSPQRKRN